MNKRCHFGICKDFEMVYYMIHMVDQFSINVEIISGV